MRRWMGIPVAAVLVTACVTINVYFPAAEAKEAAKEFVEKVIGDEAAPAGDPGASLTPRHGSPHIVLATRIDWLSLVGIGSAHAQSRPDFTLRTPAIQAIQARMSARFDSQLRAGFDAGALGFAADGTIVVRDAGKLALKDRVAINQAVADDNRDRKAVYREVAVANGHPEWEPQIRELFARQWIDSARPGWWYQSGGGWKQK
ncbi:MAG: YdbL family protein [Lysobacter sp.]|nr:YdbL family protein [Lysobacter sp.]MDQ3269159.1 YdbL family protein [Pseudomonadota bacterium]